MNIKVLLLVLFFIIPNTANAELSALSNSRIQKAAVQCEELNNELTYKKYWKVSVKPENMNTVCMAEKFSEQVATEGYMWLQVNAQDLIQECQQQAQKDKNMYFLCLKQKLMEKANDFSPPCVELGKEKLWDEQKCRRLVSYIFLKKFEDYLLATQQSVSKTALDDLSLISTWRIKQATSLCEESNNELIYKEYWGSSIRSENMNTVCMAERFADQVAGDGYLWLNKKAVELIEQCKKQGEKDKRIYTFCLEKNLKQITKTLSSPCAELGEHNLWEEQKCRRLVSYIFIQDFQEVLEANKSTSEKLFNFFDQLSQNLLVKILFNPITAISILILFVFDIIVFISPGNWVAVTKINFIIGSLILVSCFLKGGLLILSTSFVIVLLILIIFWNHKKLLSKSKEKKKNVKIIE